MSKPKIGFICVHNSCRSQMAEALGKHFAADIFDAFSGGTETKPQINQDAVGIVRELYGIEMSGQKSKLISELPPLDIVITMGCNVNCPLLPCKHREDWGLDDPSGKGKDEFIKTARLIESKIQDLKQRIQKNLIIEERKAMKIEIYEKALCCETGVCGTNIDSELLRITSLVAELKAKGVDVERANLSTKPERFIQNALISQTIRERGMEVLPLTLVDGKIVKEKAYPTNAEFEAWAGVKLSAGKQCGCGCSSGNGKKNLNVEYLYLDLSCCDRCQGADKNLEEALRQIAPELSKRGYEATLKKIYIDTEQKAIENKFLSSPTIKVNGVDIFDDIQENYCSACGTLCGDESVECRTFTYKGKGYDTPPTAMIAEAILRLVDGKTQPQKAAQYKLPDNLKKYFTGKKKIDCCTPAQSNQDCGCGCGDTKSNKKGCC